MRRRIYNPIDYKAIQCIHCSIYSAYVNIARAHSPIPCVAPRSASIQYKSLKATRFITSQHGTWNRNTVSIGAFFKRVRRQAEHDADPLPARSQLAAVVRDAAP